MTVPPVEEALAVPPPSRAARWSRTFVARAGAAITAPGRHWYVTPLYLYALSRILQFVLLRLMLRPDQDLTDGLLRWDAEWYLRIAGNGYPSI
jgi:hypothetical protein